ncbi:Uncharacterised protein [Mycobacteroides abscessus subsp. abscessus]|nr:Uncharacterised protein [Mycobacteroides abscessus subsp. abscessus]
MVPPSAVNLFPLVRLDATNVRETGVSKWSASHHDGTASIPPAAGRVDSPLSGIFVEFQCTHVRTEMNEPPKIVFRDNRVDIGEDLCAPRVCASPAWVRLERVGVQQ